jgi:hypothetical protein
VLSQVYTPYIKAETKSEPMVLCQETLTNAEPFGQENFAKTLLSKIKPVLSRD